MPTSDPISHKIIARVLAHFRHDSCLNAFAEQFLQAIPSRSLSGLSIERWASFLEERYRFFKKTVIEDSTHGVYLLERDIPLVSGAGNRLQVLCRDAAYIVITLEALFKEFGFAITQLFHPIMSVTLDKGSFVGVGSGTSAIESDAFLVSVLYVEFDPVTDRARLDLFERRLKMHLSAIQFAYADQKAMIGVLDRLKESVGRQPVNVSEPQSEWANLLDWLKATNFSFYGYCAFEDHTARDGLGILSSTYLTHNESDLLSVLQDHNAKYTQQSEDFQFDTIPFVSPVQRFENVMRLSLKIPSEHGNVVEHIFLGLLKRSSLFVKNIETPIIHLKMRSIFKAKNMLPGSYNHTEVIRIFTSIPKFELFRTSAEDLLKMVDDLLSITNPNQVYCFANEKSHRLSLLVVIPHVLFSKPNILQVVAYLKSKIAHLNCEVLEIRGDEKSRLHVHFEIKETVSVDCSVLESEIRDLIKPWEEALKDGLKEAFPGKTGVALCERYAHEFPSHYKGIRYIPDAIQDITFLEKISAGQRVAVGLVPFEFVGSSLAGRASILSIYSKKKIDLMTIMPILQNLGLHVFDEITTSVGPQNAAYGYIHSFRVVDEAGKRIDELQFSGLFSEIIQAIFDESALNDPLNRLLLKAKLDWRGIQLIQAYRNYLLQLGTVYSRDKINMALLMYANAARLIFDYFIIKFSPHSKMDMAHRSAALATVEKQFLESLGAVEDVTDDLILKAIFNLVQSSLRTNYFIPKEDGSTFISFKIDSHAVYGMPLPVPYREIYVYDVGMEGIHLRFGPVARGGLRWSDRPDDFRTEVLSLVKTQQVKNVVIVPVGSKGGFVIKRKLVNKDEVAAESVLQYKRFVSALLDITDNMDAKGEVKHPDYVVVYDDLDPYLVVAADKGTANFSDLANDIAEKYGFWLGDAFASGGSVGYNHKKEAITARGAWECSVLHFKELGKDITQDVITVAGIGDMSGDVFGNGLLLSKKVKLQAAFNHVHIFLDPDPNPEVSWQERKRLFELPRSSWRDYNPELMSVGGGIFDRKAKEITVSSEVRHLLDIKKAVVTGEELTRAILKMQVDLLWFGGIGTYIKSPEESHLQVGDPANDAVRIDSTECRALVITEGANLGVTQRARIEFNRRGGHLNTDAIDNSAGVNMSDYEVNIKILLKRMLVDGQLKSIEERNGLLEKATHQVSELVLANNRGQHRLISMDVVRSTTQFQLFNNLIQVYVTTGIIDAKTENLPSAAELEHLAHSRQPLSRPVLAVVQAYVKMEVFQALVKSSFLQESYLDSFYQSYFPQVFLDRFGASIHLHHLKFEILATLLTNRIVNQAGTAFYFQVGLLTGRSVGDITQAYLMAEQILDIPTLRAAIFKESKSQSGLYSALIKLEQILQTVVIDLLQGSVMLSFNQIEAFQKGVSEVKDSIALKDLKSRISHWHQQGFSEDTAKALTRLNMLGAVMDVLYTHQHHAIDIPTALLFVQAVDHLFHFSWFKSQLHALELETTDEIELRNGVLNRLYAHKVSLLRCFVEAGVLTRLDVHGSLGHATRELQRINKESQNAKRIEAYLKRVSELHSHSTAVGLISLSVTLDRLEGGG